MRDALGAVLVCLFVHYFVSRHIGTEQDESFYPRAAVVAVRAECTNVVGGPAPAVVAPPVVCVLARVRAHLLRVRLASVRAHHLIPAHIQNLTSESLH